MANIEFGTGKTVVILSIVAACFAVLWPKIFYPMLTTISSKKMDSDDPNGCCDVMFETDVNAFKILTEMCDKILNRHEEIDPKLSQSFRQGKHDKELINACRNEVMNVCGIDIADFLKKKDKLGLSYKQTLDEIRSFNISVCLRQNFGVNPGSLGTPRRIRIWGSTTSRHLRQERPLHFRPEIIHPALREKGRAIPQAHIVSKKAVEKDQTPGSLPVPGMRPPMGGAGHVVPPPKVGGTMSVVMPLYTIGIVIFFMYTVMKVFTKKTGGHDEMKDFHSDPEFRRVVFSEDYSNGSAGRIGGENGVKSKENQYQTSQVWKSATDDSTRLGWKERYTIMSAITGLLTEVDQQLNNAGDTQTQYSTELKSKKNLEEPSPEEFEGEKTMPKVKVIGLEMMAECEGGQRWSRPATPNLGIAGHCRSSTPTAPFDSPEPQNIFLERALPHQSQLLVSDSKTQAIPVQDGSEPEPPVILSSKMTLSLINLNTASQEESNRDELHPPQTQSIDAKSDDDNLGTTDSTLLDVDSEIIDEPGQIENEPFQVEEYEGMEPEGEQINEIKKEDPSSHYATATMSERAQADMEMDLEDTAVDVSNLDGLDATEDQEELQNEGAELCNGIARESEVEDEESRRIYGRHQLED